jgi:FG-GAP-like repeat/FG-GAP repeat/PASTA domain
MKMGRRPEGRSGTLGVRPGAVFLACVCVALTLGLVASSAGSAPSFARARSYATGENPDSLAIGDLNGDGKPELATANEGEESVYVLRNRGDGSFRVKRDYATGSDPVSVAIGDLNGDGKPDLVSANIRDRISVLLNKGDGSLQPKRDYATGRTPYSVAIGDLNGDGKPDLATANTNAKSVSVLLNRGDGSFQPKRDYSTGRSPESVAIGDLNGDGKPELATANGVANSVSVLRNRGDGSFRRKLDYYTGLGPASVAIGDLNGDGKPELATANEDAESVSVLRNRGDGSFRAKRDYATGLSPASVAIGDLNGDGKPELATANGGAESFLLFNRGDVSVLRNRGDGSFQPKLDYATGRFPASVAIGDLNGDGKPDLATANNGAASVSVLLNRPGLCTVQDVTQRKVSAAKQMIARANCRVGKIHRAHSKRVKRGRVISQKPRFGAVLPGGARVNLVVSRGRKPSRR